MKKTKSVKRGRPAKNKMCIVKKRKFIKVESKEVVGESNEYDYSQLRQDRGYLAPRENDLQDELSLMGGFQFHSRYE